MNIYKNLGIAAIFALTVVPLFSSAATVEVTQPNKGETHYFGEEMDIRWTPKNVGVATIEIISRNTNDKLNIYGRKVYDNPVNYDGYFEYDLPSYLTIRPGQYQVQVTLEDGSVQKGEIFNILARGSEGANLNTQSKTAKYSFGEIIGLQKKYDSSLPIKLSIEAFESKNVAALHSNGFRVQAHLYLGESSSAAQAVNGTFNQSTQEWDIEFDKPVKKGSYKIDFSLYCGDLNSASYCANKYGSSEQVNKAVKIKVVKGNGSKPVSNTYEVKKITGNKKAYAPGELVRFYADMLDEKGEKITDTGVYGVRAYLKNGGLTSSFTYGVYDSKKKMLEFTMYAPEDLGSYKIVFDAQKEVVMKKSVSFTVKEQKTAKKITEAITPEDHFLSGSLKSKVKVVTYSDIECPFCKGFDKTVKRMIENYGDKVAFIFRHYPLTQIHPRADVAANATECVAKLGGERTFVSYLHDLFENSPESLEDDYLSDLAADYGISEKSFNSCLASRKYSKEVEDDMARGNIFAKKDKAFGTPYSIIYGQEGESDVIRGNQPYATVESLVRSFLE